MPVFAVQLALALLLLGGGSYLLTAAMAKLAPALRLPPAAVSLAALYAASSPLLFISVNAAATGSPDIALGAVIGAVIAVVLLMPGLLALRRPLSGLRGGWRQSGGLEICAAVLVIIVAGGGEIGRGEGFLLLALFAALQVFYRATPAHAPDLGAAPPLPQGACHNSWCAAAYGFVGLALLMTGADMATAGALGVSAMFGMSASSAAMLVLGTMCALLLLLFPPARDGERAIDFLFSSHVFALLGVLGLSAVVNPLPVATEGVECSLLVLLGAQALLLALLSLLKGLKRPFGLLLLALFAVWVVYQWRLTLHLYA